MPHLPQAPAPGPPHHLWNMGCVGPGGAVRLPQHCVVPTTKPRMDVGRAGPSAPSRWGEPRVLSKDELCRSSGWEGTSTAFLFHFLG